MDNARVKYYIKPLVYAPQSGLPDSEKDKFYDLLQGAKSSISDSELIFRCDDWNGHIGLDASGFEGVHGGHAFGDRNIEGERLLEFAVANNLATPSLTSETAISSLMSLVSPRAKLIIFSA